MRSNKFESLRRVKAVEREHAAVRFASSQLSTVLQQDPTALDPALDVRDVKAAVENLEGTYVIRLFAEFETSLRTYWASIRSTVPTTRDLLDGVGARRRVSNDAIRNAHKVREHRNVLVHEQCDAVMPIGIAKARGYLCEFLSFLPLEWES